MLISKFTQRFLLEWTGLHTANVCVCVYEWFNLRQNRQESFSNCTVFPYLFLYLLSRCVALFLCAVSSSLMRQKNNLEAKKYTSCTLKESWAIKLCCLEHTLNCCPFPLLNCYIPDLKFMFTESLESEMGSKVGLLNADSLSAAKLVFWEIFRSRVRKKKNQFSCPNYFISSWWRHLECSMNVLYLFF